MRLFAIISFLLLFSLSLESIPLPIQAQIVPLTSTLALLFLPFVLIRVKVTPLSKMVFFFACWVLLQSVIALSIDVFALGAREVRVLAWARQVVALIAGLSVFFVLRRTLKNVSNKFIMYAVIAGALPALLLALLNMLWGLTGSAWAGDIVSSFRLTLIPLGYTSPARASGFSLEPSHFAFYLAVIVLPTCCAAFAAEPGLSKYKWAILLGLALMAFAWTFSTTGVIVLLTFVFAGLFLGPRRGLFFFLVVVILLLASAFLTLFPNNYAIRQISSLTPGQWSLSIIGRFYSTFGPFKNMLSSYTVIGYGLGGTVTHFTEILPPEAQQAIAAVSWEEIPNLRSLTGRLLAETGLVGLSLFALTIIVSLQQLKKIFTFDGNDRLTTLLLGNARLALIAFLVGSTIGHGSFALPYFWVWLALIDSRYVIHKEKKRALSTEMRVQ